MRLDDRAHDIARGLVRPTEERPDDVEEQPLPTIVPGEALPHYDRRESSPPSVWHETTPLTAQRQATPHMAPVDVVVDKFLRHTFPIPAEFLAAISPQFVSALSDGY